MVFSSIIFLFLYLPCTLTVFYLLDKKYRYLFLLAANLLFYAWGEKEYIILLVVFIIVNYLMGLGIQYFRDINDIRKARAALIFGLILNISTLVIYKYSYFFLSNLINLLGDLNIYISYIPQQTHLPIGVSFFTFQAISYLIDIYRKDVEATKSLLNFALYKSFFPQLIAGPIVRYKDVHQQFEKKLSPESDDFLIGIQRFVSGLGKKVIIANTLAIVADKVFAYPVSEISAGAAWLGAICYTFQIFFDFSGYSDMAIGMARMFGFKFLENFNYPYIARSVQDFWRRWHISLSSWFRDYLYIPLGGNRKGVTRTYLNSLIVFTLCGFWHGAAWTFIVWGAWHGAFLVLERSRFGNWIKKLPAPLAHTYTMLAVIIGWVIFRSETLSDSWHYLSSMFGLSASNVKYTAGPLISLEVGIMLLIAVIASTSLSDWLGTRFKERIDSWYGRTTLVVGYSLVIISIIFISAMYLAGGTYNPFIYFRF